MKNWKLFTLINSRDHFLLSNSGGTFGEVMLEAFCGKLHSHLSRDARFQGRRRRKRDSVGLLQSKAFDRTTANMNFSP